MLGPPAPPPPCPPRPPAPTTGHRRTDQDPGPLQGLSDAPRLLGYGRRAAAFEAELDQRGAAVSDWRKQLSEDYEEEIPTEENPNLIIDDENFLN